MQLDVGQISSDQVNLILTHLPVEITFVDEHDVIRYYSHIKEEIFPRSPDIIGKQVQDCHPPEALDVLQRVLDEFRSGTKNVAESWMDSDGRFVHVRYFAVRDKQGAYRGTMEVSQDITRIRKLEGEKRLLDWE